jgi:tetraacyldisaccharide 4'-kinase
MKPTLAERIRTGAPIAPPLSWCLSSLSVLPRLGMWFRKRKKMTTINARVISIGNITAGGTGKTPAVIRMAKEQIALGKKVAILTRGHGTPSKQAVVVSTDVDPKDYYTVLGDEPAVILRHVPEAILFKAKNRILAAEQAAYTHGCDVLILDDGYQYVHLARKENILLIDSTNPYGNGCVLPRGFLREPLEELRRATRCIVTRCSADTDRQTIKSELHKHNPGCPIEWTTHQPAYLYNVATGDELPLDTFAKQSVIAACAIGNPESFTHTLESLDILVSETRAYDDHAAIPTEALVTDLPIIITEKDAVRLTHPPENVFALVVELKPYARQ